MGFRKYLNKIIEIKVKINEFVTLTKLAYEISTKLNSTVLKYEFANQIMQQTAQSLGIILLGMLINAIAAGNQTQAIYLLTGIFISKVFADFFSNFSRYQFKKLWTLRDIEVMRYLLEKIRTIPVKYRNTPEFIEIERNINVKGVFSFFIEYISLISSIYGTILTFFALSFIQPYIILFAITVALISVYLESTSRLNNFKKRHENSYFLNINQALQNNFKTRELGNLSDNIKIRNNYKFLEEVYFEKFMHKYREWVDNISRDVYRKKFHASNILDIGTAVSLVVAYGYGITGIIQVGSLVVFSQAYQNLLNSLKYVSITVSSLFENYLNVKAVSDLLNYEIPVKDYKKITNLNKLEIEFKNVSFTYPGTSNLILDNISFKISSRDKLGIIGENGAGKSTLIKLLFRVYTPTSGTILLNGTDVDDISDEDYYDLFSLMNQINDVEDSMTIEDIIYLGDTSKPRNVKRIIEAAKKSGLHKDILKMDDKYKQTITTQEMVAINNKYSEKKYTGLSGGQRRKLLLSKLFYSLKPIYVLDEPTDSIDPESAYKIFKSLNELPHAQITIIVTHDVQRLQLASNKILVLKEGKVAEYGETEKLLKIKNSELNKSLETFIRTIRD